MNLAALLENTLVPALGCTEPAAIALSTAAATQAALKAWRPHQSSAFSSSTGSQFIQVDLRASRGILKNAHSIEIPNSQGGKGVSMAAALGVFCNPDLGLEVFGSLTHSSLEQARKLCRQGIVHVCEENSHCEVSAQASVLLRVGGQTLHGQCRIEQEHSRIVSLQRNGKRYYRRPYAGTEEEASPQMKELRRMSLAQLLKASGAIDDQSRELILKAIRMNQQVCQAGRLRPFGLGAGYSWEVGAPRVSAAAAGSDARMSGHPVAVMSLAGSGNQGITAIVPVAEYARLAGSSQTELVQAVALSCLVTLYATSHLGFLTPLCGVALKAALGAACGIVRLRGGGAEEIDRAVRLMVASNAGMICDGAKAGCALKVSSASEMALRVADLAMSDLAVQDPEGIVAGSAEGTIRNLATLQASMKPTDRQILKIIQAKEAPCHSQ